MYKTKRYFVDLYSFLFFNPIEFYEGYVISTAFVLLARRIVRPSNLFLLES